MIEFPIPDLLDKVAILKLKIERIGEPHLQDAYDFYMKEINLIGGMENYLEELYIINGLIWDNEHEIRKGSMCSLSLEDVGRRCLKIRDLNKVRLSIKDKIAIETKSGFKDVSMNVYSPVEKK